MLRRVLRKLSKRIVDARDRRRQADHRRRAWAAAHSQTAEYKEYVNIQLERSLGKRDAPLQERTRAFVDQLARRIRLEGCDVLCVGCRNLAEIEYFRGKGPRSVVGIDLFSDSKEILVMDMHQLTFDADRFDLIYSSHSLEHAYAPERVAGEFRRVLRSGGFLAIEAPVDFEPRGSDLVNFKAAENILALFEPHIEEVLSSERVSYAGASGKPGPPPAVRVILKLNKPAD